MAAFLVYGSAVIVCIMLVLSPFILFAPTIVAVRGGNSFGFCLRIFLLNLIAPLQNQTGSWALILACAAEGDGHSNVKTGGLFAGEPGTEDPKGHRSMRR